jgi:hypothetical protein
VDGTRKEEGAAPPRQRLERHETRQRRAAVARREERDRDERRARDQQERHAVDRREGRDLDHRQERLLAVAEQAPRELEEGVDPQQLRRHPQDRRAEQAARAEGGHQPAGRPAEGRAGKTAKAKHSASVMSTATTRGIPPPYWKTTNAVQ